MRRGVPVIPCRVCGVDTLGGICPRHAAEQQARRRNPGYDDPRFKRARAKRRGKGCERCVRTGRILHHRDGDPTNNVESNFEWLCEVCAPLADREMRVRRDGPRPRGKPSPWK